jgi:hypothetical protein
MEPAEFPEVTVTLAKGQPEYQPLPIHYGRDGVATSLWKLSPEEIRQIAASGEIWLQVMTFGRGFSPILPLAEKPDLDAPYSGITL